MPADNHDMEKLEISEQDIAEFKIEAYELIDQAEKKLLLLDLGEETLAEVYDEIFRAFHSLKGAAGVMELTKVLHLTHQLEDILVSYKGATSIEKERITYFLNGVDQVRKMLDTNDFKLDENEDVSHHTEEPKNEAPVSSAEDESLGSVLDPSAMEEFIAESEEIVERVSRNLLEMEKGNLKKDLIDEVYRDVHTLKGTSYLFSFEVLGEIGHSMESSLEKVRAGTHLPSIKLITCLSRCLEVIELCLGKVKKGEPLTTAAGVVQSLKKTLGSLSDKLEPVTEKVEASVEVKEIPEIKEENTVKEQIEHVDTEVLKEAKPAHAEAEGGGTIRVPVPLLDSLMTLMGEMVLVRNQVLQFSNKSDDMGFVSMSKRLNVVTTEIQEQMMKTRMQPIGNILSKFNRVVRDLAHDLSKEISLVVHGADTELDKSLLESIKDPLTHIVRNSCDHGIEKPDIRKSAGKPAGGTIIIRSYHEGGQVVIEVNDDGKGLNKEVLIQKAIDKGLIKSGEKLSEKEAFDLIFNPGFSTAEKITNVSGRGVGMDVVRTNIEKIGGTVELASVKGKGTSIKIKVPLTLAIVPALIVRCSNSIFAIPQVKLEELVRVDQQSSENKIEFLHGAPVYRLRDKILPLIELNKFLKLSNDEEKTVYNIAVLNADNFSFGVVIDEIYDTADIVVKPLNRLLKSLQIYSGGTILGDGTVALIFDVLGLTKVAQLSHGKTLDSSALKDLHNKDKQDFLVLGLNSPTKHALSLSYVHRLEEFNVKNIEVSGSKKILRYRQQILPLISVNKCLGYPERNDQERTTVSIIVVQRAGKLYGLIVDNIEDIMSTFAELEEPLDNNHCFFGNLNTDDGVVVVIDPFEIITLEYPEAVESTFKKAESAGNTKEIEVSQDHSSPIEESSINVLLVEDTAFFRNAIKKALEKKGYNVQVAGDGKEAVEFLNQKGDTIDIIVSDIEMPRMNGFQLAEFVRGSAKFKHLPMLAVSSRADTGYKTQGLKAGFNIYLEKLKPVVLYAAMNELLSSRRKAV